jgi:hypothetical protein
MRAAIRFTVQSANIKALAASSTKAPRALRAAILHDIRADLVMALVGCAVTGIAAQIAARAGQHSSHQQQREASESKYSRGSASKQVHEALTLEGKI